MNRALRTFPLGLATLLGVLAIVDGPVAAAGQRRAARLDSALQAVLDDSTPAPQRVIIRVRPGNRAALRESLKAHGDQIVSEHDSLDALTVVVHGEDIAGLADNDAILSVSRDHKVRPTGLLDGLFGIVGGVVNVVGSLVNVVGNVLLPNGADTSGPAVPPTVLRQTLGVNNSTWTGRGVGVAVIDSGLEMSSDFSGRVTAFYDFTTGGTVARYPYDDYGHGTHVAGAIGGSGALSKNGDYRGLAPNVKLVVLKVLDKNAPAWEFRSSTCRSGIRSSSPLPAIRSFRRLSAPCGRE
jgi:subtilisin family serine protease